MKLHTIVSILRKSAALFLPVFLAANLSAQSIISLNIRDGNPEGNSAVLGAFGVAAEGTVVDNWNNTNSFGAANPTLDLVDSSGAATGVSATVLNAGGQQYWGADYAGTPWNFGIAHFTGTPNPVSVTFDNLNAAFPLGYYALVYVSGAPPNQGAAVTDGSTTYYFQTSNPADTTPLLITSTTSDTYDVGNYAVFGSITTPLMSDDITFAIPTGSVVSNNAGIGGVQLVAIPEPSAAAVFVGLLAVGLLLYRRRRA